MAFDVIQETPGGGIAPVSRELAFQRPPAYHILYLSPNLVQVPPLYPTFRMSQQMSCRDLAAEL